MNGYCEIVKEFASAVSTIPAYPRLMDPEAVDFMRAMVISELDELEEAETVVDQADAMVDMIYYVCHCALKNGIDLDRIFELVHEANMRKLIDGKPILGERGKVVKPAGWVGPEEAIREHLTAIYLGQEHG